MKPSPYALPASETHVWSARLGEVLLASLPDVLNDEERQRAERFVFPQHQLRFRCGRSVLRLLLGGYLDCDPRQVTFAYGPQGKPSVDGLAFNLSHSGDVALLAVSRLAAVGIDVELAREVGEARSIARQFFSPAEQAALTREKGDQSAAFLRCWTRKEAIVKALGGGLSIGLASFDISLEPGRARLLALRDAATSAADWQLHDLSGDGQFAALALLRPRAGHRLRRFEFAL